MIDDFKYGCFRVDGKEFLGDLMMIQDKAHFWQSRSGRELQMKELLDVLDSKPQIIVIGSGAGGLFKVPNNIIQDMYVKGIRVIVEKNTDAIKKYNELLESGKRICGLFPGSC